MTFELKTTGREIAADKLIKDVSEARIEAELQLVQLKNMIRALDESSIVSIIDTEGYIKYVNDKFCEVSKYSRAEILGKKIQTIRAEIHPSEFYDELWDTIKSGKVWHGEICNKAKDRSYFWNKATIVPFFDKYGKIIEYIVIQIDITQQKKNERLRAIGELAARISHDIRNPLSILKMSQDALKSRIKGSFDEETKKQFEMIDRSISRMTHQINDVLDFVKSKPPKKSKIKLSEIINSSLDSFDIPSEIKVTNMVNNEVLNCDSDQMQSIFSNLFLNAIQSMRTRGELNIQSSSKDGRTKIEISDTGEGISEDKLEEIFTPLYTTKHTGTGLGLASCKSVVEAHDGKVSAKNNKKGGATFTIELPTFEN